MDKALSAHVRFAQSRGLVQRRLWRGFLLCMVGVLLLMMTSCNSRYSYFVHQRKHDVDVTPLLNLEIPADLAFPTRDLSEIGPWYLNNDSTTWFLLRCDSVEHAQSAFEYLCAGEGGEAGDRWGMVDQSKFSHGGEGNSRYCASPGIEGWAFNIPLPNGSIESYVILQKAPL